MKKETTGRRSEMASRPWRIVSTAAALLLLSVAVVPPALAAGAIEVCNHYDGRGNYNNDSKSIVVTGSIRFRAYRSIPGRTSSGGTSNVKPRLTWTGQGPGNSYVLNAGSNWSRQNMKAGSYELSVDDYYMGLPSDAYTSCVQVDPS